MMKVGDGGLPLLGGFRTDVLRDADEQLTLAHTEAIACAVGDTVKSSRCSLPRSIMASLLIRQVFQ